MLALLLLAAALLYGWNSYTLPPIIGYDAKFHAEYIETIVREGRLPDPLEGWSTFHPPLYYLLGSLVWPLVRPDDIHDAHQVSIWMLGLRSISGLALLIVGAVSFHLAVRRTGSLAISALTTALVLFVPCCQLSATMIGNEAWGVAMGALALPALIRLQVDPGDRRAAAAAGALAGLALATKYSGAFVAVACVVPFLRARLDRRMLHAILVGAVLGAAIAGPVYVRNLRLTGSLLPMTRTLEPMKSAEEKFIIRERRISDYLWFNPAVLLRPSLYHEAGKPGSPANRNPAMTNIWGLTYVGIWYDAFGHRVPGARHADGEYAGTVLAFLGLVPTSLVLLGFVRALRDWLRRGAASPEAPLVAMSLAGLVAFLAFTWRAPAAVAVKATYLLPLAPVAAVFYARAALELAPRLRRTALVLSGVAALASLYVFVNGAHFPLLRPRPR